MVEFECEAGPPDAVLSKLSRLLDKVLVAHHECSFGGTRVVTRYTPDGKEWVTSLEPFWDVMKDPPAPLVVSQKERHD